MLSNWPLDCICIGGCREFGGKLWRYTDRADRSHSLKSWLLTPATEADRLDRAAEMHVDALISKASPAGAYLDCA
jgi:hypothetical protein